MMLIDVIETDEGWVCSDWRLTYRVGWDNICKGVYAAYDFFENPEVLINKSLSSPDELQNISSKEEILELEEAKILEIRGFLKIINARFMMCVHNQTDIVHAAIPIEGEEFKNTNYEKLNLSLCQLMDSIEMAMHELI